jgi:LAO/AO transport system kinase
VGVGQSETAVQGMTDFFLLLQIAGAGDELQGIKRGIMEMADLVAVNKADGDNLKKARLAKAEISRALHFFPAKESGWEPKAIICSALTREGIPEIWKTVADCLDLAQANGYFNHRRELQQQYWMRESINESLLAHFYNDPEISEMLERQRQAVSRHEVSPFAAAQRLLESYFKK